MPRAVPSAAAKLEHAMAQSADPDLSHASVPAGRLARC